MLAFVVVLIARAALWSDAPTTQELDDAGDS